MQEKWNKIIAYSHQVICQFIFSYFNLSLFTTTRGIRKNNPQSCRRFCVIRNSFINILTLQIIHRNAKTCGAVKHCIKAVWEKQNVPEDTDSICKICLDMVGQARDQLESNETQEEIKEVFDGSCDLIPLKVVQTECKKLADDFIPELIEALASQMNPQVRQYERMS